MSRSQCCVADLSSALAPAAALAPQSTPTQFPSPPLLTHPSTALQSQGIVDQLNPNDSLSVVLFSGGACMALPLEQLQGVDLAELKRQVVQRSRGLDSNAACACWGKHGRRA